MTTTATRTSATALRLCVAVVAAAAVNAVIALTASSLDAGGIGMGLNAASYLPATVLGFLLGTAGWLLIARRAPKALRVVVPRGPRPDLGPGPAAAERGRDRRQRRRADADAPRGHDGGGPRAAPDPARPGRGDRGCGARRPVTSREWRPDSRRASRPVSTPAVPASGPARRSRSPRTR